eukprot:3203515-Amphidinium_carterae.1
MVGPGGGCDESGRPIARLVEAFDPAILHAELPYAHHRTAATYTILPSPAIYGIIPPSSAAIH